MMTIKQSIGVVACLTPWNVPYAMITRKCGGAIAAGCTTVIKPAGETPCLALHFAVLAERAGFPKGVFNVVTTNKHLAEVEKTLCEDERIKKVSFTGSVSLLRYAACAFSDSVWQMRIGKLLMQQCSGTLKKLSLELGGNSPFIIFDDCDVPVAIEALMGAKLRNSGQTYKHLLECWHGPQLTMTRHMRKSDICARRHLRRSSSRRVII